MDKFPQKRLAVIITAGTVISAIFVLTIIFNVREDAPTAPLSTAGGASAISSTPNTFFAFKSGTGLPKLPLPKPDISAIHQNNKLPEETIPFFERISRAADQVEKKINSELKIPATPAPAATITNGNIASSPQSAQKEIVLNLTQEEFKYLYPQNFLNALIGAGQNFIKEQDPSYAPITILNTDQEVRRIEEKLVSAFVSADMMPQDKAEGAITTIRFTLPEMQLANLAMRKEAALSPRKIIAYIAKAPEFISAFYGKNIVPQPTNFNQANGGVFYSGLTGILEKIGKIPTANAAIPCGGCINLPECFAEGAIFGPPPGRSLFTGFCLCWGCFRGLGCLDICGEGGIAAIWDPVTLACGCGT